MKLIPFDQKSLKGVNDDYRYIYNCIKDFHESDMDCAKIENYPHKSAAVCRESFATAIKRHGYRNFVKVSKRGEDVFLIRVISMKK